MPGRRSWWFCKSAAICAWLRPSQAGFSSSSSTSPLREMSTFSMEPETLSSIALAIFWDTTSAYCSCWVLLSWRKCQDKRSTIRLQTANPTMISERFREIELITSFKLTHGRVGSFDQQATARECLQYLFLEGMSKANWYQNSKKTPLAAPVARPWPPVRQRCRPGFCPVAQGRADGVVSLQPGEFIS